MYWYLKNLHNETISRNNLDEISRNFACKLSKTWKDIILNKKANEYHPYTLVN
jgi:hypothetical protein